MALNYLCGFELDTLSEPQLVMGNPTIQNSIVHGGKFALRCNTNIAQSTIAHVARGGTATSATSPITITVTAQAGDTILVNLTALPTTITTANVTIGDDAGNEYQVLGSQSTNVFDLVYGVLSSKGPVTAIHITVGGTPTSIVGTATTYTGVSGFGNVATANGSSTAPAITLTTQDTTNWIFLGSGGNGRRTYSATVPNVVQNTALLGTTLAGAGGDAGANATAASHSVTFTLSASEGWGAVGVELRTGGGSAASVGFVQEAYVSGTGSGPSFLFNFCSIRFYMQIAVLPSANTSICNFNTRQKISLNSNGTFTIADNAAGSATSVNSLSADGKWHQVSLSVNQTTFVVTLFVDGTQWATFTSTSGNVGPTSPVRLGVACGLSNGLFFQAPSPSVKADIYFDDVIFDDGASGGVNIGPGQQVVLLPTADISRGTNWTAGAGGTTNLFAALDNVPPTGVAPGSATNTSQIKNAATSLPDDYTATLQSYSVAGVPAGSTINAVVAVVNGGADTASGALRHAGNCWILTNPIQSTPASTTDFPYNSSAADDGVVALNGAQPDGWGTNEGPVASSPSVTLSTAPTADLRVDTNASPVEADFFGAYVDYLAPAASAAPVWNMPFLPGFGNGR